MSKAKTVLMTVAAGMAAGAILGILYAPDEGANTRKKIKKLKQKLAGHTDENAEDRQTLQELGSVLQKELDRINKKLEQA